MFLELLRSMHGAKLLRLKGIVKLAEMPDTPVVIHGVQHVFHPPARLERWPDDDHRTRLVFITRDLPERTVRELFDAFLGAAAPDRPDRAALTDNPLVPFGGVGPLSAVRGLLRLQRRHRRMLIAMRLAGCADNSAGGTGKRHGTDLAAAISAGRSRRDRSVALRLAGRDVRGKLPGSSRRATPASAWAGRITYAELDAASRALRRLAAEHAASSAAPASPS